MAIKLPTGGHYFWHLRNGFSNVYCQLGHRHIHMCRTLVHISFCITVTVLYWYWYHTSTGILHDSHRAADISMAMQAFHSVLD